ncbi:MAG: hypothetical protein NXH75_07240 [Halobacteriovoraceae bacterium]|nr:hypothetical protein [Halobacteriovoraceae bacterium]
MKSLIAAIALVSTSAFAGNVVGHIHFQSESTWVNAYYSKSLCLDGDTFRATITKCMEWSNGDDRRCVRRGKVQAAQPQESTRQRCASRNDDTCTEWETVRYFQSENVTVKFYNNDDDLVRTKNITVPACN